MKRIHVTYEDIWWDENGEPDLECSREGGFVIGYTRYATSDNAEANKQLYDDCEIDLEDEIECQDCASTLRWNGNLWVDENNSISGTNQWMDYPHHIHWPEKTVYEIALDYLNEYGAFEDSGWSFYGEYSTVDYYRGIDRQYAVHFDYEDWTADDMNKLTDLLDERDKQIRMMYERMYGGQKKAS